MGVVLDLEKKTGAKMLASDQPVSATIKTQLNHDAADK